MLAPIIAMASPGWALLIFLCGGTIVGVLGAIVVIKMLP
jgi:hypothetical protein